MELSEQSRKKAILAYKNDFQQDLTYFRAALEPENSWDAVAIKGKLHRLKGGASFLGWTEVQQVLIQLEAKSAIKPIVPDSWLMEFDRLEQLVNGLN